MRAFLLIFLVAAAVTYLLTVVAREIALRTGAVARVRDRDVHDEPIPYMGGVAMYGGLLAAFLVARQVPFVSNSTFTIHDAGAVLIAGAVICLVGVVDDIFEIDALTKLGGQVIAVAILIRLGIQYYWFPTGGQGQLSLDPTQGALLTGLMVIATVNAVNFIDGLDGLAAGVVGIGALAFFTFSYTLSRVNDLALASAPPLLSIALAGACAGFLVHNWNPARLFMGDSGSMLIGLVLSASAINLSGQFTAGQLSQGAAGSQSSLLPTFLPLALPLLILIVPLADLVLAVVRRTRAGRSPFAPDKQHLHHRLLEIGHSQRRAVLIMWLWAALIAFGSAFASLFAGPLMWTVLAAGLAVTLALTFVVPRIDAGP
ncbi:MAG: MraY family glycosyltransferase [Nocardioides sp.]|uniref:glycosyltransferase family 4 protein n=1 Tax=Nocardioides sp. TaxID=35761 RepID=UPI0039E44ACB